MISIACFVASAMSLTCPTIYVYQCHPLTSRVWSVIEPPRTHIANLPYLIRYLLCLLHGVGCATRGFPSDITDTVTRIADYLANVAKLPQRYDRHDCVQVR